MDQELARLTKAMDLGRGTAPDAISAAERALGVDFPADYAEFMLETNGGEGDVREAAWVQLWPVESLVKQNAEYQAAEFYPGFVLFGSDGGGEAYAFDTRSRRASIVMFPWIGFELDVGAFQGWTLS